MNLINPSEISARIMTLIDESEEKVILVSPFVRISKWYKLINKLQELATRNVQLELYVRDDLENTLTFRDLDALGIQYTSIPHLHSKLYLNEKSGIVSSMNLLLSSEINSLEIAYATENHTEYKTLKAYFSRYIYSNPHISARHISAAHVSRPSQGIGALADSTEFINEVKSGLLECRKNAWPWLTNNELNISTGMNNYRISLVGGRLRIQASLRYSSKNRLDTSKKVELILKKVNDLSGLNMDVDAPCSKDKLMLTGKSRLTFRSHAIDSILESEKSSLREIIMNSLAVLEDQSASF